MGFVHQERASESPYIETIMSGWAEGEGYTIRPAECHWHIVVLKLSREAKFIIAGPLTSSGIIPFSGGAELVWIKLRLGAYIPQLPPKEILDREVTLPEAARHSFWLNHSTWQVPDFENAETFINRLVRDGALTYDPVVNDVLGGNPTEMSARTVRHHFLQATGLSHNQIFQMERAQKAAALLQHGVSILDTVDDLGFYDQPHLTRSLKRWIGYTPAQMVQGMETAG